MDRPTASTLLLGALLLTATSASAQDAFVRSAVLPTTGCHNQFAWADLDGDGDLDLVSGQRGGGWVSCFENLGFATFGPERLVMMQTSDAALRVLDVGADGDSDVLLCRTDNGEIMVLENDGSGELALRGSIATGAFGLGDVDFEVSDVDGDGDEDVLFCSPVTAVVGWVENRGAAGLGPVHRVDQAADAVAAVDVGDLDGDGIIDLATAHGEPFLHVRWYRGTGGGGFESAVTLFGFGDTAPSEDLMDVDDFDGDGLDDISVGLQSCEYAYWPNRGGLLFGPKVTMVPGSFCGGSTRTQIADHDGDGDLDILIMYFTNFIDWYRNDAGSFVFGQTLYRFESCEWNQTKRLGAADIDGDGDLDIVTDGRVRDEIRLWVSTGADCRGNGVLDPAQIAGTGLDLNRNGQLDACESIGARYCSFVFPNSSTEMGRIDAIGSDLAVSGGAMLLATQVPAHTTGYFLASLLPGEEYTSGTGVGLLCLDGAIGRFAAPGQIQDTGPGGTAILAVDPTRIPTRTGFLAAMPGVTWHFQFWFRDQGTSWPSNFTDGTAVTFR